MLSVVKRQQTQAAATVLRPADLRAAVFQPSFDINKMTELLDHDNHDMRSAFRQFVSEPVMIPRYNIPLLEERDIALQRLQVFVLDIDIARPDNFTLVMCVPPLHAHSVLNLILL